MRKPVRIIKSSRLTIDEWSRDTYPIPVVPDYVYGRHLRRRSKFRYKDGTVVIEVSSDWYVHSLLSGKRLLSSLPF